MSQDMKTTDFESRNSRVILRVGQKHGKYYGLLEIIWPYGGSLASNPNYRDRRTFDTKQQALKHIRQKAKRDIASEYQTMGDYLKDEARGKWKPILKYAGIDQEEPKKERAKPKQETGEQISLF